ncbi:MAG: type II secretion system protein, partial [Candidatus Cloacimonetes bacterium]|nr:type II secretion system protein [Candidatus Cloacimonadota bacterium]
MTENNDTAKKKFSLVELLMIIMLVGIVFTITIPFHQSQKEHQMVKEAIRNLQIIAHENVKFFNNPENGYY